MGGSGFDLISTLGSLVSGAFGSSARKSDDSAAELARQRATEAARQRAEDRRKREEEAQDAAEREKTRLKKMEGAASTIATGGAGLLDPANVAAPQLKDKLGE